MITIHLLQNPDGFYLHKKGEAYCYRIPSPAVTPFWEQSKRRFRDDAHRVSMGGRVEGDEVLPAVPDDAVEIACYMEGGGSVSGFAALRFLGDGPRQETKIEAADGPLRTYLRHYC